MAHGKLTDIVHAVCHLTADSIEAAEYAVRMNMLSKLGYDALIFRERLGGLRIQVYIPMEING